jgi:hypothetical protein
MASERFHFTRLVSLSGGVVLMVCAGSVYGFGSYASVIKTILHCSESEIQFIAACGNIGLWTNGTVRCGAVRRGAVGAWL